MLFLEHVKKSFDKNVILEDVNYTFEDGNIYPVLGVNGVGKSTLFECISEDLVIDEGKISCDRKKQTFFYAARNSVFPMYISGYDFISYLCEFKKKEKPEEYLKRVGISEKVSYSLICDYSFEEKKRLQLAAFLVQKPYVIMFDEPLDYCSEEYIDTFLKVLNEEKEDHIIMISTGELEIAQRISDNIVFLNAGETNLITSKMLEAPEIKNAVLDILGDLEQ